jgi:hypothetical protein
MDVRIENGIIGLFPGACRPMTHIHGGGADSPARHGGAVLAGVFGSNDTRRCQPALPVRSTIAMLPQRLRIAR